MRILSLLVLVSFLISCGEGESNNSSPNNNLADPGLAASHNSLAGTNWKFKTGNSGLFLNFLDGNSFEWKMVRKISSKSYQAMGGIGTYAAGSDTLTYTYTHTTCNSLIRQTGTTKNFAMTLTPSSLTLTDRSGTTVLQKFYGPSVSSGFFQWGCFDVTNPDPRRRLDFTPGEWEPL